MSTNPEESHLSRMLADVEDGLGRALHEPERETIKSAFRRLNRQICDLDAPSLRRRAGGRDFPAPWLAACAQFAEQLRMRQRTRTIDFAQLYAARVELDRKLFCGC